MLSILLVDDEQSVVDTLEATIPWEELGIGTIYKALNGEDALRLLRMHPTDIVITDIHMPGISGLDLIKKVNESWKNTKCILLSGYAEFQFAQEAMKSNAMEYLLKPIADDELIEVLERIIEQLKAEWKLISSYQKAVYTLKENLPLLRGTLLAELIQGRKYADEVLAEKLRLLELPCRFNDQTAVVLIRLDEEYSEYGHDSQLLHYSIYNVFEELVAQHFYIWGCNDVHDYLVFVIKRKDSAAQENTQITESLLIEAAAKLQDNVALYLKSKISIVISRWGSFPASISDLYQSTVSEMRKRTGNHCELLLTVSELPDKPSIQSLRSPYEPPFLVHLLEAGRFETAELKIMDILNELEIKQLDAMEHLMEVYFTIAGAFTYIAHKNGVLLEDLLEHAGMGPLAEKPQSKTVNQLREWALQALRSVRASVDTELKNSRSAIIREVQEYIDNNLSGDVSLRTVAEAVYLHPNYLSTLYKAETSEGLSEYTYRLRMEKSAYYLKHTKQKIYEVAHSVGYQSPHYFIKVFKKHYGMTPQEYRDTNQ